MSMPGSPATGGDIFNLERTPQVIVYGPDGTMYPNPAAARAAGVTNYTMQPPVPGGDMPAQPMQPMPMQPLQMPSSMQMPSMNLQAPEFGIVDPTYLAQLEILNQGGMNQPMGMPMGQPMELLGSGLGPQERGPVAPFLTIPNYRPMAQSFRREAAAAGGGMSGGGGGGGDNFGSDFGGGGSDIFNTTPAAGIEFTGGYNDFNDPDPMNNHRNIMGDIFGYQDPAPVLDMSTIDGQPSPNYGTYDTGPSDYGNFFDANDYGPGAPGSVGYDAFTDSSSGDSGGSSKIVCTAMNEAYGFGSFRNRIWLAYAAKNLTKAHEAGYHALFLPLVSAGYKQDKWYSKPLRAVLENIARHRSADLRAEMRGGKRDRVGQAYRFILEPLCYAVGKLKGN